MEQIQRRRLSSRFLNVSGKANKMRLKDKEKNFSYRPIKFVTFAKTRQPIEDVFLFLLHFPLIFSFPTIGFVIVFFSLARIFPPPHLFVTRTYKWPWQSIFNADIDLSSF